MNEHGLEKLFEVLGTLIKPESIYPWLMTPNPGFDNRRPIALIENGEIDKVWRMVYELIAGVAQ